MRQTALWICVLLLSSAAHGGNISKWNGFFIGPSAGTVSGVNGLSFGNSAGSLNAWNNVTVPRIRLVNQVSAGNASGTLLSAFSAPAANNTAGNLLVVICRYDRTTTATVSDTAGNSYTGLTVASDPVDGVILQMFYAMNITGNANNVVTCNYSPQTAWQTISVLQFYGASTTSPFDVQVTATGTSGNTLAPGTLTPSQSYGVAVVSVSGSYSGDTFTGSPGFNVSDSVIPSTNGFTADEYMEVSSTSPLTPFMTSSQANVAWAAVAAVFK